MNHFTKQLNRFVRVSGLGLLMLMFSTLAQAGLSTDLQSLVNQGNDLNTQMSNTTLTADTLCNQLLSINQSSNALIDNIIALDQSLTGGLIIDTDTLTALNDLSGISTALANQALSLSLDVNGISTTSNMFDIADGLNAMLQLSSDIGTMADRILEMSDKILVMSDNISLMADRIIETQLIQNQNIALTQQSILTTQENTLLLISVINSDNYSLSLNNILSDGNWLSLDMAATILTTRNMARELANSATDVAALKDQLSNLDSLITQDAASNTFTMNTQSLNTLGDISLMLNSMAIALQGYTLAVEGLQMLTSDATLADSTVSMLQMSSDIGTMANRILEMSDLILAMSNNIGLAADNILAVQNVQNINIAATQTAILSAQTITIGVIATQGL